MDTTAELRLLPRAPVVARHRSVPDRAENCPKTVPSRRSTRGVGWLFSSSCACAGGDLLAARVRLGRAEQPGASHAPRLAPGCTVWLPSGALRGDHHPRVPAADL